MVALDGSFTLFTRYVIGNVKFHARQQQFQRKLSTLNTNDTLNVLFLWWHGQPLPSAYVVHAPVHEAVAVRPRESHVLSASGVHARVPPVVNIYYSPGFIIFLFANCVLSIVRNKWILYCNKHHVSWSCHMIIS